MAAASSDEGLGRIGMGWGDRRAPARFAATASGHDSEHARPVADGWRLRHRPRGGNVRSGMLVWLCEELAAGHAACLPSSADQRFS